MVTEFVENPRSLDEYAELLCCSEVCRINEHLFFAATEKLADLVYQVADALMYMHGSAHLIHFDIKPDNILVSANGQPFITDLGFARDQTKYSAGETVEVGFTFRYAHPLVTDPDRGARISKDPRRSRNTIKAEDIRPVIDLFAFGRTIQEVIKKLELVHGDSIYSNYVVNFLHLVACLCLDGENSSNGLYSHTHSFASDRALDLPANFFAAHRIQSFSHVVTVLERLLGRRRLENELPEVDRWSSATINVSDLAPTTLTPRVASLLNHPALKRLSGELQLGKLDTVFPTATHTRLQHSFGVYHDAREYISALYYDPENPTFRTIFTPDGGKKCLVASLVHDLGQTSFGHDLEEIDLDSKLFSHEKITERILKSDFYRDSKDRSLRDVIEGVDHDCWGISVDEVLDLINDRRRQPIDGVWHDIVNGQLDADKLDYLLRDSVECRVKYGHGIDYERFVRSLTTTARLEGKTAALRLAIEQKGAASAEAFAFARYQLYQSVYWHHTFRVVKAMLLDAATSVLTELKNKYASANLLFNNVIIDAFLAFVIKFEDTEFVSKGVEPGSFGGTDLSQLWADIQERLSSPIDPAEVSKYSTDESLIFFWKLATGKPRTLLEDLMARGYYKRIFEVSLADLAEGDQFWLRDNLKGENRINLRKRIEEILLKTIRSAIQDQMKTRESLVDDQLLQKMEAIAAQRTAFTIDLPLRGWTAQGDPPFFVSDYKRRYFRASIGGAEGGYRENRLWSTYLPAMMKGKAFFRIYCEPELHRVLTRVLGAIDIAEALKGEFPQLNPQPSKS